MKKIWTPAMRAAFARKMAKYRKKKKPSAKRRARRRNPKAMGGRRALKKRKIVVRKVGESWVAGIPGEAPLGIHVSKHGAISAARKALHLPSVSRSRNRNPAQRIVKRRRRSRKKNPQGRKRHIVIMATHDRRHVYHNGRTFTLSPNTGRGYSSVEKAKAAGERLARKKLLRGWRLSVNLI